MTCSLRIMTFNIRGARGPEDDGVNAWTNRENLNVRTLLSHDPDIIGFQEFQDGNLETYETHLVDYDYILGPPVSHREPGKREFPAVFWRTERFERVTGDHFYLNETPDRWAESWNTACVRGANWVHLRHLESGREFVHLNTHLDHVSELARQEGAKVILAQLATLPDLPVLLTGDFNTSANRLPAEPTSKTHQIFLDSGFVDSYHTIDPDNSLANTFHGFRGGEFVPYDDASVRIDWILARPGDAPLSVKNCHIVRDGEPPIYPSDHYPVMADISIE